MKATKRLSRVMECEVTTNSWQSVSQSDARKHASLLS